MTGFVPLQSRFDAVKFTALVLEAVNTTDGAVGARSVHLLFALRPAKLLLQVI